jgi:hypothetical protein
MAGHTIELSHQSGSRMLWREASERAGCDHLVSCQSTVNSVTDAHEASSVIRIPSASAILQDEQLTSLIELYISGRLKSMTGGEVFDFDKVFIVIELHHFDPSSCVVSDEPMMVEGLGESFVAA